MQVAYVRSGLVVVCVAMGARAGAEPCEVTIARAPTELRAAIERALAAEPHCRVALELRVVATDGGYYLLARDVHGRARERIVPDSASAAVLVASWAADDELDDANDHSPPRLPPLVAPSPVAAPDESVDIAPPPSSVAPRRERGPFIALYGVIGPLGTGVRGELDLVRRGRWTLGAAASGHRYDTLLSSTMGTWLFAPIHTTELDLIGYASYERDLGEAWHLRGTVGGGAAIVDATFRDDPSSAILTVAPPGGTGGIATVPVADASLSIAADVGLGISMVFGVSLDAYLESPTISNPGMYETFDPTDPTLQVPPGRTWSWSLLGGLRYEL